ncbi:MAG: hypothetical protein WB524_00065 [Acidobacteriaceae bacterium]
MAEKLPFEVLGRNLPNVAEQPSQLRLVLDKGHCASIASTPDTMALFVLAEAAILMSRVTLSQQTDDRYPDPTSRLLILARDGRVTMTTVGKSDLFEAVVQLLVLITLRDGGPRTIRTLTKQLLSKTAALTFIGAPSVSMAAAKLEMSGWIRKERAVPRNDVGRYVLTDTASRMLVLEVRDWINFGAQWPEIDKTLRNTLKSSDIELEME